MYDYMTKLSYPTRKKQHLFFRELKHSDDYDVAIYDTFVGYFGIENDMKGYLLLVIS